jgi:hypothetical protein
VVSTGSVGDGVVSSVAGGVPVVGVEVVVVEVEVVVVVVEGADVGVVSSTGSVVIVGDGTKVAGGSDGEPGSGRGSGRTIT